MAEVLQEMTATFDALEKSVTASREFHLVSRKPLIYVHIFTSEEISANFEVSIAVWDEFSQISLQSAVPLFLPIAALSIHFRPLIMDSFGLLEEGLTSTQFSNTLSGSTRSVDCRVHEIEQCERNFGY